MSPTPRPDLLDFESLKKCNAHYNLQNAFNLAEKELGLTKLLDPEGGSELCSQVWKDGQIVRCQGGPAAVEGANVLELGSSNDCHNLVVRNSVLKKEIICMLAYACNPSTQQPKVEGLGI